MLSEGAMSFRIAAMGCLVTVLTGGAPRAADGNVFECPRVVDRVQVSVPADASPVIANIAAVLSRQIAQRTTLQTTAKGDAPYVLELSTLAGIGAEGFRIADRPGGGVRIIGNDERGLLYGAGKFLRTSRYDQGGFTPGSWRGESVPLKPVRGIYFATHFHNYYHDGPVEEIQRYVEELGLWGYNTLMVWYDMHHFEGFSDPKAVEFRSRLHAICEAARKVGIDVGFGLVANEGYANSPAAIRADVSGMRGAKFASDICTATQDGRRYVLGNFAQLFDWCADLNPRFVWIWPYDSGGCGCVQCRPWGSNGFLKISDAIASLARQKLPAVKVIASTWFLDESEWQGVVDAFGEKNPWADLILAEGSIRPAPGNLPMVGFPEISMHETFPWGGFGATPLTRRAQEQWNAAKQRVAGGFPYSEGIYEDITKAVYSQFYWGDRPAEETLKEYISFEYSPDAVAEIMTVISTLERNHHWRWWPGELEGVKLDLDWFPSRGAAPQPDPGAEDAYAIVKRVDSRLPPQVRCSWRWRLLYLRALLDAELKANGGIPNDRCREAFAELISIYHAQNANPAIRPPLP